MNARAILLTSLAVLFPGLENSSTIVSSVAAGTGSASSSDLETVEFTETGMMDGEAPCGDVRFSWGKLDCSGACEETVGAIEE